MSRRLSLAVIAVSLAACAAPRPVLYPNDRFKEAGTEQVKKDVDDCNAEAKKYVAAHKGELVAKKTGAGAFFGAFLGVITGAFTGNYSRAVSEGAAVGAAAGLAHGAYDANTPDGVHRRFVDVCLSNKGYQPIGWK